jgi:DNA replication and repair protein RecF
MLATITTRGFRNLEPLTWTPGPGRHLLLGDNGAGKTSLLEAIYVLATTRSFRNAQLADCIRHDADFFHLGGEVTAAARTHLEVGLRRGVSGRPGSGGERVRGVNGSATTLAEHLAVLPVVAWEAGEGEVLTGAPALRRRFLDRGVVGSRPVALEALTRYRQALRGKRDLLAGHGGSRPGPRGTDPELLDSWNTVLAAAAAEVIALRAAYAGRLAERLAEVTAEAGLPFPPVTFVYRPSPAAGLAGAEAVLERLRRAAAGELRQGTPLLGPHRDDLEISWGGHPVKATVSAGERKALSLLLTAAHARVLAAAGREPILLLDDLDAELAPGTLARLWEVFSGAPQLVASSNRPAVWEGLATEHRGSLVGGQLTL